MGGRLALFLALRYPTRIPSLILESASPGLADERARAQRRQHDNDLAEKIEARGISWFVDYWEGLPLWASQSDELIRRQRNQRLANNPLGLANCLRGMGTGAQTNLWGALPRLALPSCLIVGERDAKFRQIYQAMHAAMPHAHLSIIPLPGTTLIWRIRPLSAEPCGHLLTASSRRMASSTKASYCARICGTLPVSDANVA